MTAQADFVQPPRIAVWLVNLEREENSIHVKVEDHGNGMSPERLAEIQAQGTGVGIRGMRERVRHFRGDL